MIGEAIVGIVSRQGPDKNPLIKRLMKSLGERDPGCNVHVQVEIGETATRGEKRQRIFTLAQLRGIHRVCILEDDTEIVQNGWLGHLLAVMNGTTAVGMVNPNETRDGVRPNDPNLNGKIIERPNLFGFCILYNVDFGPYYDPKITWLDDLAMSLQCRAKGYRLAMCGSALVRHSKEPFLSDQKPPWEQKDRSRWGEGNSYYDEAQFNAERQAEARLLVEQYGEMARLTLPPDLLGYK